MSLPTPLYAFVTDERSKPTKAGDRWFHQINLRTNHGDFKAMMWNAHGDSTKDPAFPHTGDIIEITKYVDQLSTHKSIVVNGFNKISKDQLPASELTICEFPKAKPEDLKAALANLADKSIWSDIKYYSYIATCLSKLDREKLKICPAASAIHHAYQGGLLVHTAEVLNLCKGIVGATPKRYGFINTDVLYAAAILHDIGKVQTYQINDLGMAESTPDERSIGHIYYGMELARTVGIEKGMEMDYINEVVHCIASHHGAIEWGSYKVIQSVEAGILSRADYLSSRNGMVEAKLQENIKSGQPLREEFSIYSEPYFASIGMKKYVHDHSGSNPS